MVLSKKAVVSGGGPVGVFAAIALASQGWKVEVGCAYYSQKPTVLGSRHVADPSETSAKSRADSLSCG